MPYKSQAQANLMRGIAHGFKPDRLDNPPSRAVAKKFVADSDKKGGGGRERLKRAMMKRQY